MSSNRMEFVSLARLEGANVSDLCRRFQISRKTGYKWLARESVEELSRRPHSSPFKTPEQAEARILELAELRPAWGARKLRRALLDAGQECPAASTVCAVLRRGGAPRMSSETAGPFRRFEHPFPNIVWQMDHKGHFPLQDGSRCHPFTVLDDHSRYALVVRAQTAERAELVRTALEHAFRTYGMPWSILCDNGAPWGGGLTGLEVWLMKCGVDVLHGRPYHPQTQGKLERFHRTLKLEVLQGRTFAGLDECQRAFDEFRRIYNHERPHHALDLDRPASRWLPGREWRGVLHEPEYPDEWSRRRVQQGGDLHFMGRVLNVPKSLRGQEVGILQADEHRVEVRFFTRTVAVCDLRDYPKV